LKYGDRILPSGYFESQTSGALHKCWVGFVIAKEKMEWDKIDLYAKRIQNLERELGIEVTDFSDWGIE
jgi:phage head maturation protease